MSRRIKIGGVWRPIDIFMKVKGVWKPSITAYIKIDGVWKMVQHLHAYKYVSNGDDTHTGVCSICGGSFTEGHVFSLNSEKAATCTENGKKVYVCERCLQQKTEILPALEHKWETVVISEATCLDGGEEYDMCTRCGAESEWRYTDALGHVYGDPVYNKPTCTEHGGNTYTCARCGDSWFDLLEDALGHDYKYTGSGEDGNGIIYHYYTCSRCGDEYYETE